ncbi:MAG: site-2 protease family protein [Burkholderiales bacterium]|nr:site-2 protease family protein [Opitutaceae bacterium]
MDLDLATVREAIIILILVVGSLSLHEWGHAFVADKLGDPTPRSQGRVTLDPLAHIDWVGTVILPFLAGLGFFGNFAAIGWAKPVEINPSYLRRGYRDQMLITIAGPAVNLVLALLAAFALALVQSRSPQLVELFAKALMVNVSLFVFNMLPIAPLDGSKFLMYFRMMSEEAYLRFASFGWIILIVLINIPAFRQFLSVVIGVVAHLLLIPANLLA